MFQKAGSSTNGGKKDAPLRKSDRRKLRDRALDVLFTIGGNKDNNTISSSLDKKEEWISNAQKLIDDCILAPKGGDVLSRKIKLLSGEHATLFLRTPSGAQSQSTATIMNDTNDGSTLSCCEDILKLYPTAWPYHQTTQPILLEYEDSIDRKIILVPLLSLLAALPPPVLSSPYTLLGNDNADDDNDTKITHQIPNILVHSEVSKFLCRGADLMKSGIRSFPSPWALRQSKAIVTISIIGNPQPIAVGKVEKSLFRAFCYPNGNQNNKDSLTEANLIGPGQKGVGIHIIMCYGDDLWKYSLSKKKNNTSIMKDGVINPMGGSIYDDGHFGNKGFIDGTRVYPIIESAKADECDSNDDQSETTATSGRIEQMNISDTYTKHDSAASESAATSEEVGEVKAEPNHDDILLNAFYISVLLMISSKAPLPMPISTYYAKHLLAAISKDGPKLDIKQTTYKKIGPFLKEMESEGVIKLGASKVDKYAFLTDIVKNNPGLLQFKRSWKKELESTITASSTPQKLAVVDLYIVPCHISDGMKLDKDTVMAVKAKTDERKGTGFLTKTECRALIEHYIDKEELVDPNNKGRILVNGPLCDALFKLSKKDKKTGQNTDYPTSVKRKELIEKWLERMDKAHAIVQMPGSKVLNLTRGEPKKVDIEVEFRQGNKKKFLTRIRGMEEYGICGETLSRDVSVRFACSSSVETSPVGRPILKKGRVEVVFQGHLSEELTALLTGNEKLSSHGGAKGSDYHLPQSVLNVALRKGVPSRKKR